MKDIIIRFVLAYFSYLLGERLFAATFPQGMDFGLSFWAVIKETFNYDYYDRQRIAWMAVVCALLIIADRTTSKKWSTPALLAIFAAFAGGYYYHLPYSFEFVDRLFPYDTSGPGDWVNVAVDVFGAFCALLMVAFPMVLLVGCKGVASLFRRRAA